MVVRQRKRKGRLDLGLVTSAKKFRVRKILAPVDFSPCSMAGAMYGAFMSKALGATLSLFHVVPPHPATLIERASVDLSAVNCQNLRKARLNMKALGELDFLRDTKCGVEIRLGDPVTEICGETKEHNVDLVVISTHGRDGFKRMLLGSVAEQVVRQAECPVLVVPGRCATDGRQTGI